MRELLTVITRKGQITVPAEVRRALGIKEGDKMAVSLPHPGAQEVTLRPVRSVTELTFGSVPPLKRAKDAAQLRRGFEEAVAENALAEGRPGERNPGKEGPGKSTAGNKGQA